MFSETPQSDQGECYSYSVGDLIWKKIHKKKYYKFLSRSILLSPVHHFIVIFDLTFLQLGMILDETEEKFNFWWLIEHKYFG